MQGRPFRTTPNASERPLHIAECFEHSQPGRMIRAAAVVVQVATHHTAIVEHGIAAHPGQRKPPLPIDRRGACDRLPGIEDFTLQGPQTPDFAPYSRLCRAVYV